jgi:hypothetical protein
VLIADSVPGSILKILQPSWVYVVKFKSRVTEALKIQEGVERMENEQIVAGQQKAQRKKHYMMLSLATSGESLLIYCTCTKSHQTFALDHQVVVSLSVG